jgi:hypothetical protein
MRQVVLTPVLIIEVVAGEWRVAIRKHPLETSVERGGCATFSG